MTNHPMYLLYGLLLTGAASWVQYTGWTFTSAEKVNNVPKSIRDNPGVYRSHYGYLRRYSGGK